MLNSKITTIYTVGDLTASSLAHDRSARMDVGKETGLSESWDLNVTPNPSKTEQQTSTPISYGGPLTLILFGGEAATEYGCITQSSQKIGICAFRSDSPEVPSFFKFVYLSAIHSNYRNLILNMVSIRP
ncbi:unnamed protein product [Gongylonema pulchrum]|uniref:Peptidase A1 domain-containing protein n=1 Tax=Gongylonema pulchrum TaxID=637853 RepID=A0A183CZW1_9BILA|nr:unnamed protein product [Gongylonema pulchrum]